MVRIDAVDGKRRWFKICALKGLYVETKRFATEQGPIFLRIKHDSSDFKERVSSAVKSTGFNIDNDRQKAAKPVRDRE